ncbi:MAG: hypothetical protein P4L33_04615 [Capsulimonadaceae bacterium]|nr:hypothetical protein [Capsulimonadaceae bacterium]
MALGRHAVDDDGKVAAAFCVNPASRTYCLVAFKPAGFGDPELVERSTFTMDAVRRIETLPDDEFTLAMNDGDLSFIDASSVVIDRTTYQPGRGMLFVDIALAGTDPRRTMVILSMTRSGDSYTLSAAEGGDTLVSLWTKTWATAITAIAISSDGNRIAVGLVNGVVALLDRAREIMWECLPDQQEAPVPIASLCVDGAGTVVSVDDRGSIRRHAGSNGRVQWRYSLLYPSDGVQTALFKIAADMETRVVAATSLYYGAPTTQSQLVETHYTLIDGESGATAWYDDLDSPATGVAVSPNGQSICLSCRDGEILGLAISILNENGRMSSGHEQAVAQTLYDEARYAAEHGELAQAAPLLLESLRLNPTNAHATTLFDEVVWHLREEVMTTTTQVSEESLAKVDEALKVAPHDEKLTIRRNALARLLAERYLSDASKLGAEGKDDDALAKLKAAVSLDRHNVEMRMALKHYQEKYIGRLFQECQTLLARQLHEEAIKVLEKVQALRPDEPGVIQRLSYCRAALAFKAGMQHYNLKHYPQAIFQFKKTLQFQPAHPEARTYLELCTPVAAEPATVAPTPSPQRPATATPGLRGGVAAVQPQGAPRRVVPAAAQRPGNRR